MSRTGRSQYKLFIGPECDARHDAVRHGTFNAKQVTIQSGFRYKTGFFLVRVSMQNKLIFGDRFNAKQVTFW